MSALVSFPWRNVKDGERLRALNFRAAYTFLPFIFQLCRLRPENPPCDLLFSAGRTAANWSLSKGIALHFTDGISIFFEKNVLHVFKYKFPSYKRGASEI